jgi:hypothetical protein
MMSEDKNTKDEGIEKNGRVAPSHSRVSAIVVLITAIPLLLLSSLALALFYAAPARFEHILTRLPGEAAIRTILIFAPVTLLAIIVLAVLYAVEKPSFEVTRPQVVQRLEAVKEPITRFSRLDLQHIAWWVLLLSFAALLFLIPARAAAFLSPTRFENLLGRVPGGDVLSSIVHSGPIILLILEILAVLLLIRTRMETTGGEREILMPGMRWLQKAGPIRLSVGIVLLFSLPILLVSVISLVLFFARTESFLNLIDHLPAEVPLRMGLVFIPASLIIVASLAVLFLVRQRSGMEIIFEEIRIPSRGGRLNLDLLLWYLSWVLAWIITLASAAIVGLVIGLGVLILR